MPSVNKNEASGAGGGCPLRRALDGRDPTPHEPWPARPREKPAVESPPYLAQRRRTWRYDVGRARNGGPKSRSRVSARGAGQTNIRTFRRPPRAWAGRQASPHRPQASGRGGVQGPTPVGEARASKARRPFKHRPGVQQKHGAAGSLKAPEGASTARVGPPLPRRERAALLAERDGGAQARRPSEPATGARPGPDSATAAGPRSPGRDRRPRGAALAWANRPDRSPTDRPRSSAPRRFRVASKRCSNS